MPTGTGVRSARGLCWGAGADYLGVAQVAEAVNLREEVGPGPAILAWIYAPGAALGEALSAGIELSVGAFWALDEVAAAAAPLESRPRSI